MNDKPLISVIIPSYNSAHFVTHAVRSALGQTYRPLEVIVVDDGSTDDTQRALSDFEGEIRYVYQANKGAPGARNTGIRQSRGDFVAFLDADDEWCPDKLSLQVPILCADSRVALVHSDITFLEVSSGRRYQKSETKEMCQGRCYEAMFFDWNVTPSTVVVRRECIEAVGLFDESLVSGCEELDLWFRLARWYDFAYVPMPLTVYRLHSTNMTRNTHKMDHGVFTVKKKALDADPALWRALGKRRVCRYMSRLAFDLGYAHVTAGELRIARGYFRDALRYTPQDRMTWAFWGSTFLPSGLRQKLKKLKLRVVPAQGRG